MICNVRANLSHYWFAYSHCFGLAPGLARASALPFPMSLPFRLHSSPSSIINSPIHRTASNVLHFFTMSTRKRKQDAEEEEELRALPSDESEEEEE